jgi:hypothetical protein
MFLLAEAWTRDRAAAIVAGLAYGFSSFTLLHNAHLNLTWNAGLPLTVLALERWWSAPTWPRLFAWWAPAVFTVLVSWYLAIMLVLLMAMTIGWLLVTRSREATGVRAVQLLSSAVLAAAIVLPFLTPYLGRGSEPGEATALAADWRSYLVPPEHTLIGRELARAGITAAQGIWGERTLFLGWTLGVLALAGAILSPYRALLVAVGLVAVALSFGPSPTGWSPYDLLARLPGVGGFRATARFALLVVFSSALLTAGALAHLCARHPRVRGALAAAAAAMILGEVFAVSFPPGRPYGQPLPAVYEHARADAAAGAVALPMYAGEPQWFFEGDYLLYSTTADFVPLVNGIGRWVPPEYLAVAQAMRAFPEPSAAETLRFYGVTHVILHRARYGRDAATVLDRVFRSPDFSVVATHDSDTLLRVNPR